MELNKQQRDLALKVWRLYAESDRRYLNANDMTSSSEIDRQRLEQIPIIKDWINKYIAGEVELEEFKSSVDSINKRHRLWGFKGMSGQMFFNMLTNTSMNHGHRDDLDILLKQSIQAPADLNQACKIIQKFAEFTAKMADYHDDKRAAPKPGAVPYFLSYFWQIQDWKVYPVYYSSFINAVEYLGIWSPSRSELAEDYKQFYELTYFLWDLYNKEDSADLTLWDVEHAYWYYQQLEDEEDVVETPQERSEAKPQVIQKLGTLPESYIPPVVSIVPLLAANDPEMQVLCSAAGKAVEVEFEDRLHKTFEILGFEVERLGQGSGRNPDGIALNREYNYAIIFDAKTRQDGYSMGAGDERAIREYIHSNTERLRRQGYRNVYFMIISSRFRSDHDEQIRNLKIDTDIREVILLEAEAIMELVDGKLRDPYFSLGPTGFQSLLASSGLLTSADVQEFLN